MLARREPGSRILLTTFTTNLADQLRADLDRLDPALPKAAGLGEPGISVYGIDAVASAVLRQAGADAAADAEAVLGVATTQLLGRTPGTAWQEALDAAGGELPTALRSPQFLAAEYAQVVLPNRITSREAYYKVRRPGRGVALDRAKRAAVWDVIEAYRAQARIAGSVDFPEAATIAAAYLRRAADMSGEYVADHVLVDEGQDLGPAHWQLLRALVGEHADDLFIAEDSHQRIYGQRVVLSQFGIRIVGRSQRLTLNYRTTAQNLGYAINVLEGGAYVDLESGQESTAGYRSARSGPVPQLIPCATLTEELDRAADLIRTWVAETDAPETIAVLVREQRQRDRLVSGLAERGVTVRAVDREHIKPGQPVAMTMHRAKGTEFSKVLLFGIDQGAIPRPLRDEQYAEDAWADALLRERSLLYVAATRARDELALSWSGDPSQLLPPAASRDCTMMLGPLTAELDIKDSPVRRFLDERFTSGLRDVQRRYRAGRADARRAFCGPAGSQSRNRRDGGRLAAAVHAAPLGRPSDSRPTGAALCGRRSGMVEAFDRDRRVARLRPRRACPTRASPTSPGLSTATTLILSSWPAPAGRWRC